MVEQQRIDPAAIEKALADLWRTEMEEKPATRAALWNVVAHTDNDADMTHATEVLARVSESVPQRSVVIRADAAADSSLTAWVNSNCHLIAGGEKVCSEQISISAGGDRIYHVPSLVNALLIPDMPVAIWWLGDLPDERRDYVAALLAPANRLVVDSVFFDIPADLRVVASVAGGTDSLPADLNWMRLDEWRNAAASLFDSALMRPKLQSMRKIRVVSNVSGDASFGDAVEAIYFIAWMARQSGLTVRRDGTIDGSSGRVDYVMERTYSDQESGAVRFVEIHFEDGSSASIERQGELGAIVANIDGVAQATQTVTRMLRRDPAELIVRQLSRRDEDRLFADILPLATRVAEKLR